MTPALTACGRSFKGAAAYYLHDKRGSALETAARPTAERVAWTEVLNLPTADPDRAWRMMVHTAMMQAELKAAAGIKASGRKLAKPVLAYSLSWHPDERPTRAEQIDAAKASLAELDLSGHQTVIIAHNDTPHAHVHVLVNRVNPINGVAATLSNSKLKLSAWAQRYEEGRGRILCAARIEANARRQTGEIVRQPRVPRNRFEAERARSNDNLAFEFTRTEQAQKDAHLYAIGRTIKASHARQWTTLEATYAGMLDRMRAIDAQDRAAALAAMRDDHAAQWRTLLTRQQIERDKFFTAEQGVLSKIWSIAASYRGARAADAKAPTLSILWSVLPPAARRALVVRQQLAERRSMAARLAQEIAALHHTAKDRAGQTAAKLWADYLRQGDKLRITHLDELAAHRKAWTLRNQERRAALAPHRADHPDHRRSHRPSRPQRRPDPGQGNKKGPGFTF